MNTITVIWLLGAAFSYGKFNSYAKGFPDQLTMIGILLVLWPVFLLDEWIEQRRKKRRDKNKI